MNHELTENGVSQIFNNTKSLPVVLQVLKLKKVQGDHTKQDPDKDVFLATLSDGQQYANFVLPKKTNGLVFSGDLLAHGLVRVDAFKAGSAKSKTVVVTELTVLASGAGVSVAGSPTFFAPQPPAAQESGRPQQHVLEASVQPVSSLNPYLKRWTIKGRVTAKTPLKTWKNEKGEGKVFSFDLLDGFGGEITVTAFNKECDAFFSQVTEGHVVFVSKGAVRASRRAFSAVKNPYAVTLGPESEVVLVSGEDTTIAHHKFAFVGSLEELLFVPVDAVVDVLAVVWEVGELVSIVSARRGKTLAKRSLLLVDASLRAVALVLWEVVATELDESAVHKGSVVAAKGCKVTEFAGARQLALLPAGKVLVDPSASLLGANADKLESLCNWHAQVGGGELVVSNMSVGAEAGRGTLHTQTDKPRLACEVKDEMLGFGDKPEHFALCGFVHRVFARVDRPPFYDSCPAESCKKKVQLDGNGFMFCAKCQASHPSSKPRYIFTLALGDFSGSVYLSCFGDAGNAVFGCGPEVFKDLRDRGDSEGFEALLEKAKWKLLSARCLAKCEEYNGENKVRVNALALDPVDFAKQGHLLLKELQTKLSETA